MGKREPREAQAEAAKGHAEQGRSVEEGLARQGEAVDPGGEEEVGHREGGEEDRRAVAQELAGQELPEQQHAAAAQHVGQHVADAADPAAHDARAPPELLGSVLRPRLARDGLGLVHDVVALRGDLDRQHHVVGDGPVEGTVEALADGEDRAVGAEEAGEAALHPLELLVVAPVQVVALGHHVVVGGQIDELAADTPDLTVGEVAHEHGQGVLLELAVGVREQDDVPPGLGQDLVQGAVLAPAGQVEDAQPRVGELPGDGRRPVRRSVRGDDDLEAIPRVVEAQAVQDLLADHVFFVVRGDDQRHARKAAALEARLRAAQRAQQEQQDGIARVDVRDRAEGSPEDDGGQCQHGQAAFPARSCSYSSSIRRVMTSTW